MTQAKAGRTAQDRMQDCWKNDEKIEYN